MAFGIKNNCKSIQQYSTKANTTINMRLKNHQRIGKINHAQNKISFKARSRTSCMATYAKWSPS
jgi:hypothetical protein